MRTSVYLFHPEGEIPTDRFANFLEMVDIPGTNLRDIDDALQARFFQKKPGTNEPLERWELEKVSVACPEHTIRELLAGLGFINRVSPRLQRYDRAGWPGALAVRAGARLLDLKEARANGVQWNETVVFGGKRPLIPDKESFAQCCAAAGMAQTANALDAWESIAPATELDMMRFLWVAAKCDECGMNATFVDAPMKPPITPHGPPVRPSTEDTIHAWCETDPAPGSMLVSSGAPYGMAQNEAYWMVLGPKGHTVETFGHAVPPGLGIEAILRELSGTVNRIRRARCT